MRIVILTTDTSHHNYIVREIGKKYRITLVLDEKRVLVPPFEAAHPYERQRDEYEWNLFFQGSRLPLQGLAPTSAVPSVNDPEALRLIAAAAPDVIIDIGTGKVSSELISLCPNGIINLHGGNPEEYRGLDSHLWAIYHGDYENLMVTLHRLSADLDSGDILSRKAIALSPKMKLLQLRAENVKICIELLLEALDSFSRTGLFQAIPLIKRGRYYSFMPNVLKEVCLRKFERYTGSLS